MAETNIALIIGIFAALALLVAGTAFLVLRKLREMSMQAGDSSTDHHFIRLGTQFEEMKSLAQQREDAMQRQFRENREELSKSIKELGDTVRAMGKDNQKQQNEFRDKLDDKMKELRQENSKKLDEMRKTVDERLQTTLEKRLSESFKTVSERLEAVHKGLGEMQSLATGVGDLKRVLTNVKTRGTFGEVQLEILIQDFLTPEQYVPNYDCGKAGGERVEFGIKMPGTERDVYLSVDAKFPSEDYERLLDAVERGHVEDVEAASKALEKRIRTFAKDVSKKYINPPHTMESAILFLPTEGLFAEALRRPGLFESLQRDLKVTLAGPTNFQAMLNTFRMGFRQVALAERANEVWDVLGAVKNEFEKYGDQIAAMGKNLQSAQNHIEKLETRKRAMLRALKTVETVDAAIPDAQIQSDLLEGPDS